MATIRTQNGKVQVVYGYREDERGKPRQWVRSCDRDPTLAKLKVKEVEAVIGKLKKDGDQVVAVTQQTSGAAPTFFYARLAPSSSESRRDQRCHSLTPDLSRTTDEVVSLCDGARLGGH